MSKKVVNLKTVLDFFYNNKEQNEKTIKDAYKIIREFNKQFESRKYRPDVYAILSLTESRLQLWFKLRGYVKKRIKDTQLEDVFKIKYETKFTSYKDAPSELLLLTEPGFYQKINSIHRIAMDYICYHHLVEIEAEDL